MDHRIFKENPVFHLICMTLHCMVLLILQMREERQRKRSNKLWMIMKVESTAMMPVTVQLTLKDSNRRMEVMHFNIIFYHMRM